MSLKNMAMISLSYMRNDFKDAQLQSYLDNIID